MTTKTGDVRPLARRNAKKNSVEDFRLFAKRYLVVPRGSGAGKKLIVRDWQLDMLAGTFCDDYRKFSVFVLPRGNGKSGLIAAVALWHLMSWGDGARVLVVAQNDSSAKRLLRTASRMVELSPELSERLKVTKDQISYPATDSVFLAVASEQSAVEGEDITLGIVDEIGFIDRDVYEAVTYSMKREGARLIGIGTPSTPRFKDRAPLWDLVTAGRAGDPDVHLVEYSAPDEADIKDVETWLMSNPGLGDLLAIDDVRSMLPPKTREQEFRRARLGQWVTQGGESFMPDKSWQACARKGVKIPPGTPVVLSLDGSQRWDATVLIMTSVSSIPHQQVLGWWFGDGNADFEVSHLEVEETIRRARETYRVRELTADPFLWQRTLQVLEDEGLNVTAFPQHGTRMPRALAEYRAAALAGKLTHADDVRLNKHMITAQLVEGGHGLKLAKPSRSEHIDGAIAATMGYSRAFWLGSKKMNRRTRSFQR